MFSTYDVSARLNEKDWKALLWGQIRFRTHGHKVAAKSPATRPATPAINAA